MNVPKKEKDYCKKCNAHTEHKIKLFKTAKGRALSEGNRKNKEKKKGYKGKYQFTATIKKQTKKPTFVLECSICGAKHYKVIPKKMKKTEIREKK